MHLAQSFGLIKKKVFQVYEERDPLHVRMVNLNSTNLKVNGGNMLKHCGARIFYLHEGCHFILLAHLIYISLSRIVHLKLLFLAIWLDCRKNEKSFDNLYNPVWKTLKKIAILGFLIEENGSTLLFYLVVLFHEHQTIFVLKVGKNTWQTRRFPSFGYSIKNRKFKP